MTTTTTPAGRADAAGSSAAVRELKFAPHDEFYRVLRKRVDDYFRTTGLSPRDVPRMYLKTAVLMTWLVASYLLLVFVAANWWQGLLCGLSLGMAMPGVGFSVMHDGGHQAYSRRRWVNELATLSLDLLGGSSYIWGCKHNLVHHTYTNIAGWDDDIAISPIGRISPHQEWRPFHRFQHVYLWPLYGLIPFKWYFVDDFRDLLRARIGQYRFTRPRGWDLAAFVGGKLLFLVLAFLIPLTRHPVGTVLAAFVGVVLVEGFVLAIVFQMAHVVGEAAFPTPNPDTGRMDAHWSVHQAETAVDYARNSRFVTWFVGGLNYQIEHHLLPHICHLHYPALSGLVEQTCREFGVHYMARPTFRAAVAAHYRWLKQMGRGAADAAPAGHA